MPLVTVKAQAFRENGKDTIGRGPLKVSYVQKIVGEFSEENIIGPRT